MSTKGNCHTRIFPGFNGVVPMNEFIESLQERIGAANASGDTLSIVGGASKHFYGGEPEGEPVETREHQGVVSYDPTELVITVRAGTCLAEVERILAQDKQGLPFEPPSFGVDATIGGTIACGFSGPARPYRGAARDHVLGVNCVSGRGDYLRFGGQVMKNVAGYDVSRLMTGALGTLGVITEVSLKVLPLPARERTRVFDCSGDQALEKICSLERLPLPVTASAWHQGQLRIRLSGSEMGVDAAVCAVGGDDDPEGATFWAALKEQQLDFFSGPLPLWRLSMARPATMPDLPAESLVDWGGSLYWFRSDAAPQALFEVARSNAGHLTRFRGGNRSGQFQGWDKVTARIHQGLNTAFDPAGILNRGRLFGDS